MKIVFLVKCVTLYGLREKGDVVEVDRDMAQMLISGGYAALYTAKTVRIPGKKTKKATK